MPVAQSAMLCPCCGCELEVMLVGAAIEPKAPQQRRGRKTRERELAGLTDDDAETAPIAVHVPARQSGG